MDWDKSIELMQLYLLDHRESMTPDDVNAHLMSIGAMMMIAVGTKRVSIEGVHRMLIGRGLAVNIPVQGGDSIGVKSNLDAELNDQKRRWARMSIEVVT